MNPLWILCINESSCILTHLVWNIGIVWNFNRSNVLQGNLAVWQTAASQAVYYGSKFLSVSGSLRFQGLEADVAYQTDNLPMERNLKKIETVGY